MQYPPGLPGVNWSEPLGNAIDKLAQSINQRKMNLKLEKLMAEKKKLDEEEVKRKGRETFFKEAPSYNMSPETSTDIFRQAGTAAGFNIPPESQTGVTPTTPLGTFNPQEGVYSIAGQPVTESPKGAIFNQMKPVGEDQIQQAGELAGIKKVAQITPELTQEVYTKTAKSNNLRQAIKTGLESAVKIPTGTIGKYQIMALEKINPNSPVLADWQNVKSVLSELQLYQLQFTKGAISDKEMEFFSKSVANNEIQALPKIRIILNKAIREINANEDALFNSYKRVTGDDPRNWKDLNLNRNLFNQSPAGGGRPQGQPSTGFRILGVREK